jgi:hypothetical protein
MFKCRLNLIFHWIIFLFKGYIKLWSSEKNQDRLSQNQFCLIKYLYFLKKEFDDKINDNEIPKFSTPIYLYKMKNIRYIVIFDTDNQHPLYDLQSSKIIDAQKCKILYQIKHYSFKFPFTTPLLKYFHYCKKFFKTNNYFNNEKEKKDFLDLTRYNLSKFIFNYHQYFFGSFF